LHSLAARAERSGSKTSVRVSIAQIRHGCFGHRHLQEIDVAPGPALAGLERRDDRVRRSVKMLGGVPSGRAVAAADVTACQAEPEMDPGRARLETLFTSPRAGRSRVEINRVLAGHDRNLPMPGRQELGAIVSWGRVRIEGTGFTDQGRSQSRSCQYRPWRHRPCVDRARPHFRRAVL
jgi:hypothetical protein